MRIGMIGLGKMGANMTERLLKGGHEVVAFDLNADAVKAAAAKGAEAASSLSDLAGKLGSPKAVWVMLPAGHITDSTVEELSGLFSKGDVIIDGGNSNYKEWKALADRLESTGVGFVDAPVTGSSPKAEDGTLTIMAGGEEDDVKRAWPLFEAMGKLIVHVGPLGQGETLKLIGNAVAAANAVTVAQALLLARATEVDLDALTTVLAAGSGGSTMLDLKSEAMREHDYTTLFKLDHMIKDVALCLEESEKAGVPFPSATLAEELLEGAARRGHGEDDFAAVIEEVEARAARRL